MKCVAGHQCNLYPYGGFFAKAASVDHFVIVDNTQYVKKEFHNRNRIRLSNGNVIWLGIPVRNSGKYKQLINEVEIDNVQDWRKTHCRTLFLNYKKAPFFDKYFPELEKLLQMQWRYLSEFNIEIILLLFRLLDIQVPVCIASKEGISGKATELILDICRKTGSDAYLHGKHSRDYVDFPLLEHNGIRSYIQNFECLEYPQTGGGSFVPNLSVIDTLFNCGDKSKELLLHGNKISPL